MTKHSKSKDDKKSTTPSTDIGGCKGTKSKYGCCDDNKTEKTDSAGSNCPSSDSTSFWKKYRAILIGVPIVIIIALMVYFLVIKKKNIRNNYGGY